MKPQGDLWDIQAKRLVGTSGKNKNCRDQKLHIIKVEFDSELTISICIPLATSADQGHMETKQIFSAHLGDFRGEREMRGAFLLSLP